ncbi:MAG: PhnD/SsuA/transferrin family substrate-binding protein [Oscillospiraceae bacterium]|nr:PhnD/SsuA/transferrin family substrate-binding protein [Oscillospiraceae bacterium]
MQTKKLLLIMLIALSLVLAACAGTQPAPPTPVAPAQEQPQAEEPQAEETVVERIGVNVGGLYGPTGIALVGMADQARRGEARHDYNVTFVASPDIIQGRILSGELDIAAMPTNLAAMLYNRTEGEITMVAMSRLSVLHIVQATGEGVEEINSIEDLRGRTLHTHGQGTTQEHVLNFLLRQAGLDPETDLEIVFQPEHAAVVAHMLDGRADVGMLPQPFVTTIAMQNPEFVPVLSINDEWQSATGGVELAMSCIVVRTDFLERNPQAVLDFLQDFAASAQFAMDSLEQAAELVGEFGIIPEPVALRAIPYTNISSVTGQEMKTAVQAYLMVLYEQNPASVGGTLPDEGFFFVP